MVGDGEAVRLVADALQQVEALAGARQDDRVVLTGQPDLLQPLGQPDQRDVVHAELVQRGLGGRDLGLAAVDHDELRGVREAPRAAGGWIGEGVQAGLGVALLDVPGEATADHLAHRRGVIDAVVPADGEAAVLALARQPVLEHDHRGDDVGALHVADVEALDPQRRHGQLQRLLQLGQRH